MRPVVKMHPGDFVMLPDGQPHMIPGTCQDYKDAKPYLIANLGSYCSYCEEAYRHSADLQVEHVQPKSLPQYAHLEKEWSNLLLACSTCNGKGNKGDKNVVLDEIHLPHRNNTFMSLLYKAGGVVIVNPALTGDSYRHAEILLSLVGLNKDIASSTDADNRWMVRSVSWDLAKRYLVKYKANEAGVDTIIDLVKARGGWSIWFTVFAGEDEVRKALIEQFPGTAVECFDANNHYEPIFRNAGQADPV